MPRHRPDKKKFGEAKTQARKPKLNKDGTPKKFGGKQEGAGRPAGALSRRTRMLNKVTDRHIRGKRLPLDVMIENMIHYQDDARGAQAELAEVFAAGKFQMDKDEWMKAIELLAQVGDTRMKAQKCAVDAAPFIHAKLSSIAFTPKHSAPQDIVDGKVEEARDDFRSLRSQQYVPPVIEGEAELVSEYIVNEDEEQEA